jgi:transposase
METVITRVAGLDVHQATVVATVRVPGTGTERLQRTETFGTTTAALLALRDWLQAFGVTHVAMESTGVYWKPVYYVLEEAFTLLVVDLQQLKRVPGRKSDIQDSAWEAQLLEWGLLHGSFVPPPPIRELRDLTRYQSQQMHDRAREVNRLCKVLEDAGIKLSSVVSDVMGVSGRAMVTALAQGTTDPAVLADLARGRLRTKLPALREALRGRFGQHHGFLVEQILAKIDFLDETVARLTEQIDGCVHPFATTVTRLCTIPGIERRTAIKLIAETGGDMRQFPTAAQLCSWSAVCPGTEESAGKRRSGKTRNGNRYLRAALIQSALSSTRARTTALAARYRRIRSRRGHKKAVVAVAHQILEIAYYVMRDGVTYRELGPDYLDRRDTQRVVRRHVRQLEALGYRVAIEPAA